MYKVILLGDNDYEQSHVVTSITKVSLARSLSRSLSLARVCLCVDCCLSDRCSLPSSRMPLKTLLFVPHVFWQCLD
jgi:hypothetical protein